MLAHVADEGVLKDVFRAGEDVHAATAAEVFEIGRDEVDVGQRSKAKMVNFGIVYGLTGFGLADRLNIPRKEGEEFVSRYLERFPAVRRFREEIVERAQEQGYVTTLMGRRRAIPELRSGNPNTRRLGERLAVNTVIQGTAADIIKVAMVRCQRALRESGGETRLVLQIHDELLFEGPPRRDGRRDRAGAARDVRRLPARSAARGRRRRRPRLARRQVATRQTSRPAGTARRPVGVARDSLGGDRPFFAAFAVFAAALVSVVAVAAVVAAVTFAGPIPLPAPTLRRPSGPAPAIRIFSKTSSLRRSRSGPSSRSRLR